MKRVLSIRPASVFTSQKRTLCARDVALARMLAGNKSSMSQKLVSVVERWEWLKEMLLCLFCLAFALFS